MNLAFLFDTSLFNRVFDLKLKISRVKMVILKGLKIAVISWLLTVCFTSVNVIGAKWYQQKINIMGTTAKVELWSENETAASMAIQDVFAAMEHVNATMIPYIETSELYKINKRASQMPMKISTELFQLLEYAIDMSLLSNGAFDITFSSVGYLYNYREHVAPSATTIKNLKNAINYRWVKLESSPQTIFFKNPNVKIDLGGIAKGYAVDEGIKALKARGIKHALVNAGGDSRIIGDRMGRPWYIGIKHPRNLSKVASKLPLVNVAVSTSGDYERFFEKNGVRYHHIIDPKTGSSSKNSQSVTIIADTSTYADALSTSVFVLGVEEGLKLVNGLDDVSAVIIDAQGKLHYSDDLVMQTQ
ncbi:MAG: FAD:protein FMN transferase [Pseudomonadota bacterium]